MWSDWFIHIQLTFTYTKTCNWGLGILVKTWQEAASSWPCRCWLRLWVVVHCGTTSGTFTLMVSLCLTSNKMCFSIWSFWPWLRKLEDKLLNHRIEFRSFFLPMDLGQLHHNREMPAGFTLYLCVSDCTLPAKGTAHRANRNAGKVLETCCSFVLKSWRLGSLLFFSSFFN